MNIRPYTIYGSYNEGDVVSYTGGRYFIRVRRSSGSLGWEETFPVFRTKCNNILNLED